MGDWRCSECGTDVERKGRYVCGSCHDNEVHAGRDRMLDLLLKLEWAGHDCLFRCPACENPQARGHASDCELVAVLRAAGVRP